MHAVAKDWRSAPLSATDRLLCEYANKLTLATAAMHKDDIHALRDAGLSDRAIHDATQVIAYFNYINRVAEALGVQPETFVKPWGQEA